MGNPENKEHGFRTLEADIKSGIVDNQNCILLFGDESFLIEIYEKRLMERYVEPSVALLDFIKFDGEDAKADDIIAACDTLPMLSQKRVVLVSGDIKGLTASKTNPLIEYIPIIPKSTLLVIATPSVPGTSALFKEINSNGKSYKLDALSRADVKNFVRRRFEAEGKQANGQSVDEIIKLSLYFDREDRGSLHRLAGDVSRIAAYAEGSEVTISDVIACMGTSIETDIFALMDAVSAGNKGTAMEIALNITSKNEGSKKDRTFNIISMLTAQFEIMLGYKELENQGFSLAEITKRLNQKSEYRVKKAAGYANKYSTIRLMELLHRVYRIGEDIKTGLYGDRLALTMFIAEM